MRFVDGLKGHADSARESEGYLFFEDWRDIACQEGNKTTRMMSTEKTMGRKENKKSQKVAPCTLPLILTAMARGLLKNQLVSTARRFRGFCPKK